MAWIGGGCGEGGRGRGEYGGGFLWRFDSNSDNGKGREVGKYAQAIGVDSIINEENLYGQWMVNDKRQCTSSRWKSVQVDTSQNGKGGSYFNAIKRKNIQQSSVTRPKKSGPIRQTSSGPSHPPLVDVSNESRKEEDVGVQKASWGYGGVHDHVMLGRETDSACLDYWGGKENFTHSL
ncbi:hypothetical protein V6N11_068451 [Hibiscus sabdariffa]|uniref:Uncharacterized protein n=1 Tax=Hibiscus sabdariffa TaxID=183260 RepID=A0ABR2P9S7_9ROSI